MSGPPRLKVYGLRGEFLKKSFTLIYYRLIVLLNVKVFLKVNPVLIGLK
jgi:hypothetical protein